MPCNQSHVKLLWPAGNINLIYVEYPSELAAKSPSLKKMIGQVFQCWSNILFFHHVTSGQQYTWFSTHILVTSVQNHALNKCTLQWQTTCRENFPQQYWWSRFACLVLHIHVIVYVYSINSQIHIMFMC